MSLSLDLVEEYLDVMAISTGEFLSALVEEVEGGTSASAAVLVPSEHPESELAVLLKRSATLTAPTRHELKDADLTVHPWSDHIDQLAHEDAVTAGSTWLLELSLSLQREEVTPAKIIEVATALGAWGKLMRRIDRHEQALHAFCEAFRLHGHCRRSPSFVRLLQRYAYVLNDLGRFEEGIDALGEAIQTAGLLDLPDEHAKFLVDHGMLFANAQKHQEGLLAYTSAIRRLPESLPLCILASLHGKLWCQTQLGDSAGALETLKDLRNRFPTPPEATRAYLLWSEAELARLLGEDERALTRYRQACDLVRMTWEHSQQAYLLLYFGYLLDELDRVDELAERLLALLSAIRNAGGSKPLEVILLDLQANLYQSHRKCCLGRAIKSLKETRWQGTLRVSSMEAG